MRAVSIPSFGRLLSKSPDNKNSLISSLLKAESYVQYAEECKISLQFFFTSLEVSKVEGLQTTKCPFRQS